MKKVFLSLFFSFCSFFLFAEEKLNISFTPLFSVQNGILNEYVWTYHYEKDGKEKTDYKLSELNWNILNNFLYGEQINLSYNNLGFICQFQMGGNISSDFMTDSDWQNPKILTQKTNYSISENTITSTFISEFEFYYSFKFGKMFCLNPLIDFSFSSIKFEARNAEGWYGDANNSEECVSWDDEKAKHYKKGQLCGIDYFRNTFNIILGVSPNLNIFDKVFISAKGGFNIFTHLNSVDTHFYNLNCTSGNCYNDRFYSFFTGFNFETNCSIKFSDNFSFGCFYKYNYLFDLVGTTFTRSYKGIYYSKDQFSYPKCSGKTCEYGVNLSFSF